MKPTIPGGCRVYNHRHFPNTLHAQFVKLKKDTGKTIEYLIVAYLELAIEMGGRSKSGLETGNISIKPVSQIKNDSSWELASSMIKNVGDIQPTISEDLCMPYDVVAVGEETT